jgi:hypothetical protein
MRAFINVALVERNSILATLLIIYEIDNKVAKGSLVLMLEAPAGCMPLRKQPEYKY